MIEVGEMAKDSSQSGYTPTPPQQDLINRLGITLKPGMDRHAVCVAIDRAAIAFVRKAQADNPALEIGKSIVFNGDVCKITQYRAPRVQLMGEYSGWVSIFEILDAKEAPISASD